jgi:hypothetical protein
MKEYIDLFVTFTLYCCVVSALIGGFYYLAS